MMTRQNHKNENPNPTPKFAAEIGPPTQVQEETVGCPQPAVDNRIGAKTDGQAIFSKTRFDLFR